MAQDGFVDWLRDTFSADPGGLDDFLVDDQKVNVALPVWQGQHTPDTAVLIQQMQNSLMDTEQLLAPGDIPDVAVDVPAEDVDEAFELAAPYSKAAPAKAPSQRPKNTKRYKSQAQKDAHKRYRERKRASITAMEETVREMLQQLTELEAENAQLKSKCRVLETSVNCSTQIHGLMQLLDGINSMSLNPSVSNSPVSHSSGQGMFGLQMNDRQNSNTASDTSGGDTWSSSSGLGYAQPGAMRQQQQLPDPWQRMPQTRVITTGAVHNPAAAAANGAAATADAMLLNSTNRSWSGSIPSSSTHQPQQQRYLANGLLTGQPYGSVNSTGSTYWGHPRPAAGAAAPAGPYPAGLNGSNSLQAIFAEVSQQQNGGGGAVGLSSDVEGSPHGSSGSSDPLAGAVTSVEQGMGMYKEFLRQASQLMLQVDAGGPGAEAARATLEELTRVTMSRFQPLLVAKGQGLVYTWITRNLETGQHQEASEELWPKVLEQMRLTPQQQQDALACYRMFSICLSKLVDKRVELTSQYKALQQHSEQCEIIAQQPQQGKLEAAADYRKSKLTSASMEVLQSLAKNLAAYQSLDGVFAHSVTSLLTGVQMATACVHSYPFLPQWHTMMRNLMRQEDAKQQLLQQQQAPSLQQATRRSGRSSRVAGAVKA